MLFSHARSYHIGEGSFEGFPIAAQNDFGVGGPLSITLVSLQKNKSREGKKIPLFRKAGLWECALAPNKRDAGDSFFFFLFFSFFFFFLTAESEDARLCRRSYS